MSIKQGRFCVILHNIRSAYNVGSIFRTADAFGVDKIFLGGYTPNPEKDKKVKKTALGAEEFIEWETCWQTYKIIERLKKQNFNIVALEQARNSINLRSFKPKFHLALVLGNEVRGLSKLMLAKMDKTVEIPMQGEKESLNVAVAFGVAAYILNKKF